MGNVCVANGEYSLAAGASCSTGGTASVAMGNGCSAGGAASFAIGYDCTTAGTGCFAMGVSANTSGNNYCLAWGDSGGIVAGAQANSAWFATGTGTSAGPVFTIYTLGYANPNSVVLSSGASSWGSVCDRAVKANLAVLDSEDVIRRLAAVPVYEFNYINQPAARRCRAPVAQEWAAAFPSEGKSDKLIESMDLAGVTLAAVHGLIARTERLATRCAVLEAELATYRRA